MGNINILEWIGYLASILILVSMLMSSVLKLRLVNLTGSAMFSIYGFLIGSLPVGLMNLFVVFANIYHLYRMSNVKEHFNTLEIKRDNRYLKAFIDFYQNDIVRFFPRFEYNDDLNTYSFMVLRNMAVAGVFLARDYGEKHLFIGLDYVIPQYRDLKPGKYIYKDKAEFFKSQGYEYLCTVPHTQKHAKYLEKMGFAKATIKETDHYIYKL